MCPGAVRPDGKDSAFWRLDEVIQPCPVDAPVWRPDILITVETSIDSLDEELRKLSLEIHEHPELGFEEHHAHDVLTQFMINHGFSVTKHYVLQTAWVATFTHGAGGRTIGINSEMDALPGMGHACGHNLIAIAGVAVACAAKSALVKHSISGTITLLGTPAEEDGAGKRILLDAGAYKDMDACVMCHPSPGPNSSIILGSSNSLQRLQVEYAGHGAHAALSPWEGRNAVDAAVVAYNSISVLRQQLHPTVRVHGVFQGKDHFTNIIPDISKMSWILRAPTWEQTQVVAARVKLCLEAAAMATGCKVSVKTNEQKSYYDLRQNKVLSESFEKLFTARYGPVYHLETVAASTDFGNVTYALPGLHPNFAIPTVLNGGNHTPAFTRAAATPQAHKACLNVSKALAATGIRVLVDDEFFVQIRSAFEQMKALA